MELSFCIVELSEGSPSRMRNRNLILCKEFAFFFFGTDHQDGNFQTEFPCSCRGWNWNFFSQWCSCGSGISHSVCRLRGAAWCWLRLACHGFPFSKLKSTSLDKSKRGCPHILLYLSRVPLAPTSLKTILLKSCFFSFFRFERLFLRFVCVSNFLSWKMKYQLVRVDEGQYWKWHFVFWREKSWIVMVKLVHHLNGRKMGWGWFDWHLHFFYSFKSSAVCGQILGQIQKWIRGDLVMINFMHQLD